LTVVFGDAVKMVRKLGLEKNHPLFAKLIGVSKKMVNAHIMEEEELVEIFNDS
jgi:hypothetical protein